MIKSLIDIFLHIFEHTEVDSKSYTSMLGTHSCKYPASVSFDVFSYISHSVSNFLSKFYTSNNNANRDFIYNVPSDFILNLCKENIAVRYHFYYNLLRLEEDNILREYYLLKLDEIYPELKHLPIHVLSDLSNSTNESCERMEQIVFHDLIAFSGVGNNTILYIPMDSTPDVISQPVDLIPRSVLRSVNLIPGNVCWLYKEIAVNTQASNLNSEGVQQSANFHFILTGMTKNLRDVIAREELVKCAITIPPDTYIPTSIEYKEMTNLTHDIEDRKEAVKLMRELCQDYSPLLDKMNGDLLRLLHAIKSELPANKTRRRLRKLLDNVFNTSGLVAVRNLSLERSVQQISIQLNVVDEELGQFDVEDEQVV
jgi:hypothetical protein